MVKLKHYFPGPKIQSVPHQKPLGVIDKLYLKTPLTKNDARELLDWLVYETSLSLLCMFDGRPYPDITRIGDLDMARKCRVSYEITEFRLHDLGAPVDYFVFHSQLLPNTLTRYGHYAIVVTLPVANRMDAYLIDPTFRQFCLPDAGQTQPGNYLARTGEGRVFMNRLLRNGYAQLTTKTAAIYLKGFSQGQVYYDARSSLRYLKTGLRPES